jgi:hypothetical protein
MGKAPRELEESRDQKYTAHLATGNETAGARSFARVNGTTFTWVWGMSVEESGYLNSMSLETIIPRKLSSMSES